ncbi:DUF4268 domain-containing protein [Shewanella sp. 11B5]|uniref:DUF4268 domain-containing protein n=1 Tax=unclassified Shewanella TaxID=196818 RepID=UPI000C7C637E|nr:MULTISPECIES: DUF4268 domain-containing protein [unclassified Shewanella]MBB1424872.1 DUF4268 domain-containing protein [Shewanella sp. SG44-2]PKI06695.1 DUF4268 domain-containing protein [Shewanella sp. 11B5]|tara:strand:+ start:11412 stop:12380 length:969 start_codon:yes stop_codon:yes gene_type:complete
MFGSLKKVPLRNMWPHEALDFTPWLAENIDSLGLALGLELELIKEEACVGDFSLDLLAKDLSTSKVAIIENQLTQTDHDHLGKLLTYAAGFDASFVIWVAESIREEHRQALEWLNNRTDTETQFFAVVVEVLKIDDSKPAYNFKPIVFPNEWHKSKTKHTASNQASPKGEKYRNYFQYLIDELREKYHFTSARAGQPQNWYTFSSGISGSSFGANFCQGSKVRTELYIDRGDADENMQLLQYLEQHKTTIETEFGCALSWESIDGKRATRVAIYQDGSIEKSSAAELELITEWHIKNLLKFKSVFTKHLKSFNHVSINTLVD